MEKVQKALQRARHDTQIIQCGMNAFVKKIKAM
jgi:hypothetical protein